MLVLSRKIGETIHIGDGIVVTVLRGSGGRVRLGIEAPAEVSIKRGELLERMPDRGQIQADDWHAIAASRCPTVADQSPWEESNPPLAYSCKYVI